MDILARIQKRAQELKELGGELPPEVAKITNIEEDKTISLKEKKSISGFSLVAGYSDSEDEEGEQTRSVFKAIPEQLPPKVSHSTLFPITQPVDVKDFEPKAEEKKNEIEEKLSDFGSKAFQRKKRIGVALMNTVKIKDDDLDNARRGFGFEKQSSSNNKSSFYASFEKGGVMFVKSGLLNPASQNGEDERENESEKEDFADKIKVEELYSTLIEKLGFLNAAHPEIPPTQSMVIQAEVGCVIYLYIQLIVNYDD